MDDGNYQEALQALQALTLQTGTSDSTAVAQDFGRAITCMQRLNRAGEIDSYCDKVIAAHNLDWVVLAAVANSLATGDHQGFLIADKFERGQHRGGGRAASAAQRDRVRALQLFETSVDMAPKNPDAGAAKQVSSLFTNFASTVMRGRNYHQAWRLQSLTDLTLLPDYEEGWGDYNEGPHSAPVDAAGNPVFYNEPASWKTARNDGERWRWLLAERSRRTPNTKCQELLDRAEFLHSQFGVQTMAEYRLWPATADESEGDAAKGRFSVGKLTENETIARLATGIKRFDLPDDQNPIRLLQQIQEESKAGDKDWRACIERLAGLFEDRRQYPRAAEYWKLLIDAGGDVASFSQRFEQIVGNWGRFEPLAAQPAGRGATLYYRFRNGKRVGFTARPVKLRALLDDLKTYLKSDPSQLDWQRLNIDSLGYRLIVEGQDKYLGKEAAKWSMDLEPRSGHLDRRVTVTTPSLNPGAYLIAAKMDGGNTHYVVLWLNDAAIVKKPLSGKALYFVADSVTGEPLKKCNIEFFGFRQQQAENQANRFRLDTRDFAEFTDDNGMVVLPTDEGARNYSWLAIASTPEGKTSSKQRLAFIGFSGVWAGDYYDQEYKQLKVFTIADRPVYRPGQSVNFKFWVANAQYDQEEASPFAGQSFIVEIRNGRNEKVYSQSLVADSSGGLSGSWQLPLDAMLGQYQLTVVNHGGGTFRVEEYKKPEFEVAIQGPDHPVKLGDKIKAHLSAKYYFGAPVTDAKVRYKVLRSERDARWFPPMPWDWLYGNGYWWFPEDYTWYPGWSRWGCARPWPWWYWRQPARPEVVAEQETTIGPDGELDIEIDTSPALEFHGDQDHSYRIEAEVVDQSRRTIVANSEVLVSRRPFAVYLWTRRGYYNAGDTVEVEAVARTVDGKPVKAEGVLRLMRIAYDGDKPIESEVARWDLPTDGQGQARLQIKASEPGQYRLAYELRSKAVDDKSTGAQVEAGQVILIRGDNFDGGEYRFNDVEIVPDKREYAAGDTVHLQVSANRSGATVLVFLRPSNGIYLPPQVTKLVGKSAIINVPVTARDMPNFFIEAVAVHSGGVHTAVREIFVPPVKRVYNVELEPSAKEYLPGEHAKIAFRLTGADGKPLAGSTVVAIYDRSLDYIAGGAGTTDIREFFWKWRRSHNPQTETNLGRTEYPVVPRNAREMQNLGVFGDEAADAPGSGGKIMNSLGGRNRGYGGEFSGRGAVDRSMALPMAAPLEEGVKLKDGGALVGSSAPQDAPIQPVIRQNFADTALWVGALATDAEGRGEVELDMPENLTSWKIKVWAMGPGTRVGEGSAEVVTRKNIVVRLQAPRFFVERDEVVLSAIVHNYLKIAKQVEVKLELEGDGLECREALSRTVEIPAGGEKRVDWLTFAVREGQTVVRMSALTDTESDAMQMTFPVLIHGMLKTVSATGSMGPDNKTASIKFTVPKDRRPETARLEVRYSPSLAGAMVDALPYLIDYPHGCTEQTLNRFLPAVLTQRTLRKLGVDLKQIQAKQTNLNAQEIGDDAAQASRWKRFNRNPVFSDDELSTIVKAGVQRLTEMQLSDGGWGWFSGWGEQSSAHTTATVVRGLLIAKQNGVALVPGVVERGVEWLANYQATELAKLDNWDRNANQAKSNDAAAKQRADDLDALVYLVLVDAKRAGSGPSPDDLLPPDAMSRMKAYIFTDRTHLAVYSLATFGLALHMEDDADLLPMVMRNISQYVRQDNENQTAWLDLPGNQWWYWYSSEYEAHAYYLKLLSATDPKGELAPRLVKYLLNNRKHASYWNSTRDTALVVEAFSDYLAASGEATPQLSVEVLLDGKAQKKVEITPADLFTFDNTFFVEGSALEAGEHTIEFRKHGQGPLYFSGYLTVFTLEDPIRAAGLELKVERKYYKLTPAAKKSQVAGSSGQVLEVAVEKYDRTQIVNLQELKSGDLVEVELVVDSKNDYEYILLEDMKPAGFEAVDVRSGYTANELGAYVEYRDERVVLFVRALARGRHSVSYRLRAEIPGKFSALPTKASAMYAPELKANGDEARLQVVD